MSSTGRFGLGTSLASAALMIALFSCLRADFGELRADIQALRTEVGAENGAELGKSG